MQTICTIAKLLVIAGTAGLCAATVVACLITMAELFRHKNWLALIFVASSLAIIVGLPVLALSAS